MIYIVSGFMRTGTSMMMNALYNGGLTPYFSSNREKMNEEYGDDKYKPNEGGFYEIPLKEYKQFGFPRSYEGYLIKVMVWGLRDLAASNYRIVLMTRDPEEIRQSFEAFQGKDVGQLFVENYWRWMQDIKEYLDVRKDIDFVSLQYRDVVENPHEELSKFKHWGVDVDSAVGSINYKNYRFRKEILTEGI